MNNKNIYNVNWKILAAQQQFSVRGIISVIARRAPAQLKGNISCEDISLADVGNPTVQGTDVAGGLCASLLGCFL
jgi:hypothetical protein